MNPLHEWDAKVLEWSREYFSLVARLAMFVVFFWFGVLKVFHLSPATPLVNALFDVTLAWLLPFTTFSVGFGLFEVVIGLLFLWPKFTRLATVLLALHLVTTAMPLILVPSHTWNMWFVPTLEGQYIIKNVLIVALAIGILAKLSPLRKKD